MAFLHADQSIRFANVTRSNQSKTRAIIHLAKTPTSRARASQESSSGAAALGGMAIAGLAMIGAFMLRRHKKSKEELRAKLLRALDRRRSV